MIRHMNDAAFGQPNRGGSACVTRPSLSCWQSALSGRSMCDGCGRPLSAVDLVPLLSFVGLRGRARCCGATIPALHWQVEAGCAVAGFLAGLVASDAPALLIAGFGWLLVLVVALDATEFWIPDPLPMAIAALRLIASAQVLLKHP